MRQLLLCVILDRLAQSIGPVMAYPASASAVRSFTDLALDPATMVHKHPEDYDLMQVGFIDEGSGVIEPCVPPVVILTGAAWAASQQRSAPENGAQLSLLAKEA